MLVQEALRTKLLATATITTYVNDRVYPKWKPQDATLPAISYRLITGISEHSHDGISGLAHDRFQIDCWARTYKEAVEMADAVRLAIDCKKETWGTLEIQACLLDTRNDTSEGEGATESVLEQGRVSMDYIIWYKESQL